ncbi:MAG: ABC transporter family substrate-binding protein [Propioniciclava sp.]|uniref:ABC transporter family substrate-binding protein n=1 Tax=Propioniciclava sp. TaxID=2038686 RepID=UPI0039E590EA
MSKRKFLAAAGIVLSSALAFTACTPPTPPSGATTSAAPTAVNVAWNQAFFSYNDETDYGNATANANIIYMANERIAYYDKDLKLAQNASFGKYEKLSDSPLTVKYTFADTATWSDGTPVTGADAFLLWAALSGVYNTTKLEQDTKGNVGEVTGENVYFNGSDPGLELVTDVPEISADGKSITLVYSKPFVDWEILASEPVGVPAHIVGKKALGIDDNAQAAKALVEAFKNKDNAALAKISNVFNTAFNFKKMPDDKELLVGNGPYVITDLAEEQYVVLEKNPNYKGSHKPSIDKVTVRVIPDAQASVTALANDEVLVTQPQSTADILTQLQGMQNTTVLTQDGGTYEHVDLVFANGGPFDPAAYGGDANKALKVRQAFLHTIPRQKIIDTIIKPLNPEAAIRNTYSVVPGAPNYDSMVSTNGMKDVYGGGGDVEKAKALLAEAGVSAPTVRVKYASNNTRRQQQFQLIKESAEAAGFVVQDVGSIDWGQELRQPSLYDASLFGWQSTSTGVHEAAANYITGGQNNYGKYSNAEVDRLFAELGVTIDPAEQKRLLEEAEKHLVNDGFGITIYQFPEITGISSKIKGVASIPLSPNYFWNFWEWKLS